MIQEAERTGLESLREILFVEDDEDHAELLIAEIEDHDLQLKVRHYDRAETALAYLDAIEKDCNGNPNRLPQLILLDINLPGMSGLEMLKRIRMKPTFRLLPVVMLTSSKLETLRAYESGANSYVVKPVSYQKFQKVVVDLCSYWGQRNLAPHGSPAKPAIDD